MEGLFLIKLIFYCLLQVLLEAINDFNFNANGLWRARIGAYDVEKSDMLKIMMSNPTDLNLTLTEESRQVPELLKDCNSYKRIWV